MTNRIQGFRFGTSVGFEANLSAAKEGPEAQPSGLDLQRDREAHPPKKGPEGLKQKGYLEVPLPSAFCRDLCGQSFFLTLLESCFWAVVHRAGAWRPVEVDAPAVQDSWVRRAVYLHSSASERCFRCKAGRRGRRCAHTSVHYVHTVHTHERRTCVHRCEDICLHK